ncbi:UbiA family prenyltransferase [Methanosphaera sp. WGK6]|uniref:UbiA family prenyltransferase n=1 Tax=Methanosphaera sp. WGK6 TaxID=1561964 RepID=UPI00084CE4D9|nr:UbiA family prenyltransferase [Methanosphaera sp. WGK6]OED29661.1 prenyltransferase [Methanosphaera sp. WGK6]
MNSYIEILRPGNAIMALIAVLLMAIVGHVYNWEIILGAITVFIATGAGNTINDYYDYEIDKINKPQRPLPSGRIKKENALYYSLILYFIAIIMGFIISFENGITVIICTILMIIYAYNFKQKCLIGNITVALLTGLTFVFGGLIINQLYTSIILGFFAFLMTLSREIIKDTEDIEGDLKENAQTFPIKYGSKNAVKLAVALNIITCLLSPLLYIYNIFSLFYMIIVLIADIIFIYTAILALRNQTKENLHKISGYMKIGMLIAFISFAVGSLI